MDTRLDGTHRVALEWRWVGADARMAANPHTFPSGAVVRCSLPSACRPPVVVAVDEGGWAETWRVTTAVAELAA